MASIDGVTVLEGRGHTATSWIAGNELFSREPGLYRLQVRYRSLPGVAARVQLCWESETFARETLPAARLKHVWQETTPEVQAELTAARGRLAVERLGCARCHATAFPGVVSVPPGPSLADVAERVNREWLMSWLADPRRHRPEARMPALFDDGRQGRAERWLVAEYLLHEMKGKQPVPADGPGDYRAGQQAFLGMGCIACHQHPEHPESPPADPDRHGFASLRDRMPRGHLAAFLEHPARRYPDGRMPRLPVTPEMARNIAEYLLQATSTQAEVGPAGDTEDGQAGDLRRVPRHGPAAPADIQLDEDEIDQMVRRLGAQDRLAAGKSLLRSKRCIHCHPGLGEDQPAAVAIRHDALRNGRWGCLSGTSLPRYALDEPTRRELAAYLAVAAQECHASAFEERQRRLRHVGCFRCHQRDGSEPAPLEQIGRTVWAPFLMRLPFQRTPRLTQATAKFTHEYLLEAVRDGVRAVRPEWYSYRMPSFGEQAEEIVRALAEGDGELPGAESPQALPEADPTVRALGPLLVGFSGYACVTCHVWNGQSLSTVEPGTVGPELTTVVRRIRRDWFDRFLDDSQRIYPATPMPSFFRRGEPARLDFLDRDAARQKDAIWAYLSLGQDAPAPQPKPPAALPVPAADGPPLVAQVPLLLPEMRLVESLCVWYGTHDLLLYDLEKAALHGVYTGAHLLRQSNIWRTLQLSGNPVCSSMLVEPPLRLAGPAGAEEPGTPVLQGYRPLPDGVCLSLRFPFSTCTLAMDECLQLADVPPRRLVRRLRFTGLAEGHAVELRTRLREPADAAGRTPTPGFGAVQAAAIAGQVSQSIEAGLLVVRFTAAPEANAAEGIIQYELPPAQTAAPPTLSVVQDLAAGSQPEDVLPLQQHRPGYVAITYPRPKTASGEDRIMPSALAVDPRNGRVFLASLKQAELLWVDDPQDDGESARYVDFAHGLFQDVFGMLHDGEALYVLHRRNLSALRDTDGDGRADRCDRLAALPHSIGNAYDWAYGLLRDAEGAFLFTFAPHASQHLPGSGSLLRLIPGVGGRQEEIAFGFRNPLGWCRGPGGEIFFTDNQGEWVPTNKLCHVVAGRYYGYPNPAQASHAEKPLAPAAVWVPYNWAKSINGVAYDVSGKFGPFAGQFFMAELMHGGAILRANLEQVNGVYQGACFPFWGNGLLGPLVLAFDVRGRLWVGAITQPDWMGQPDRGALFRIEFTGEIPFEIQSIHALPRGFKLVFTKKATAESALDPGAYRIEQYRYEHSGAYGSPELDRKRLALQRVKLADNGRSVELLFDRLVKDRIYSITAAGVRSEEGEALVHPTGVYTLNQIPTP
jgi:mono/diheme cytochrome c family protein/glucose/arabinose dehydrogenase